MRNFFRVFRVFGGPPHLLLQIPHAYSSILFSTGIPPKSHAAPGDSGCSLVLSYFASRWQALKIVIGDSATLNSVGWLSAEVMPKPWIRMNLFASLLWEVTTGETITPNVHQRLPIETVSSLQGGKIGGAGVRGLRFENYHRQVEAMEQFGEKEANGAAVEIGERMDSQKPPFGKR